MSWIIFYLWTHYELTENIDRKNRQKLQTKHCVTLPRIRIPTLALQLIATKSIPLTSDNRSPGYSARRALALWSWAVAKADIKARLWNGPLRIRVRVEERGVDDLVPGAREEGVVVVRCCLDHFFGFSVASGCTGGCWLFGDGLFGNFGLPATLVTWLAVIFFFISMQLISYYLK